MKSSKGKSRGKITDIAETLWAISSFLGDADEREAWCNNGMKDLISGSKGLSKRMLIDKVTCIPGQLKTMYHSKEALYEDFKQNVCRSEFLIIVEPLDSHPTPWGGL